METSFESYENLWSLMITSGPSTKTCSTQDPYKGSSPPGFSNQSNYPFEAPIVGFLALAVSKSIFPSPLISIQIPV